MKIKRIALFGDFNRKDNCTWKKQGLPNLEAFV
jgi:hypothetical protein